MHPRSAAIFVVVSLLLASCAQGGPPQGDRAPRKGPDGGTEEPTDPAECGSERARCCWDGDAPCESGLTCVAGSCTGRESCGADGMTCCTGAACEGDLVCVSGRCATETRCGRRGERCCDGESCAAGLVCSRERSVCEPSTESDCGGDRERCCAGERCASSLVCTGGTCGAAPACGGAGESCCSSGSDCYDGLSCVGGRCQTDREDEICGGRGQACCGGSTCTGLGLSCCAGMCIDVRADDRHCGRCDRACEFGTRCETGTCEDDGSSGDDDVRCGLEGATCCSAGSACVTGLTCSGGRCSRSGTMPSCGSEGGSCCASGSPCYSGLACSSGRCVRPPTTCGAEGAICCTSGTACMTGLTCDRGRCLRSSDGGGGACGDPGDSCTTATSCCRGLSCREGSGTTTSRACCYEAAGTCESDRDCCGDMTCNRSTSRCQCRTSGQTCRASGDCCTGLACESGTCRTPSGGSDTCTDATSCSACASRPGCGWCGDGSGGCRRGSATGPTTGMCGTWRWLSSECSGSGGGGTTDCSGFSTCSSCTGEDDCVWCTGGTPRCMNAYDPMVCAVSARADYPSECSSSGGGTTPPSGWTCAASWYGTRDGCDCACGAVDPDCSDASATVYHCAEGEVCSPTGTCVRAGRTVPSGWTCTASYYDSDDGCDCNCGVRDPDCSDAGATVYGCASGETCGTDGRCTGGMSVPPGWTCTPSYYGSRDGCDCGCGVRDPDCDVAGQTLYGCDPGQTCSSTGTCTGGTTPTGPPSSWTCPPTYYGTMDGCDCECGAPDPDCVAGARVYGCESGQTCTAGRCTGGGLGCGDYRVCQDCLTFGCGYCGAPGLGTCMAGTALGPSSGSCTTGWRYGTSSACSAPTVPSTWTCTASWYAGGDGCDCECGAYDPDCDTPGATVYRCAAGQTCSSTGRCTGGGSSGPPPSWTCTSTWYGGSDGCDCECGAPDPDCVPGATVYRCAAGQTCDASGHCTGGGSSGPPSSWTCTASWYDGGDGCDCECGAYDPDCSTPGVTVYRCAAGQTCDISGHCTGGSSGGPPSSWTCDPGWYDNDDGCDCACGARDPDCDSPGATVYRCPAGATCDSAGDCVLCTNTCAYHDDDECDDGSFGSATSLCALGTDCNDCGPHYPI